VESKKDRIVQVLSAPESPLRAEGVALAVDQLLGARLAEVVDLSEVASLVVSGLTHANVERTVVRHVKPGWERYGRLATLTKTRVEMLVPHESRERIRELATTTRPPAAKWAENMIDPALLRRLLAPVWVNLLVNFGKRVMGGGSEVASGSATSRVASSIAGRLGKSVQERAEKLVDAGRTVMGGLGAEVERRVQAAAREFAEGAATLFRDALRDRLESAEGRELLARIASGVVDHVMSTPLSALQADADRLPVAEVLDLVPNIVAHAAGDEFVQSVVVGEISAFVVLEGERTLRELLGEANLLEPVRAMMLQRGSSIVQGLVASEAFGSWLERLLDA
jgi:hypothetical protein